MAFLKAKEREQIASNRSVYHYLRVKEALTNGLHNGRWHFGEAIPSEATLAKQFEVSVGTVRHSIDELVAEGILVRQHGRGTFVASHTPDYLFNVFFRIVDPSGNKQRAVPRLLSFRRGYADKTTAESLKIQTGASIYRITNAIALGNKHIAYDEIFLPRKLFPGLISDDLSERNTTVYGVLQHRYNVDAVWAREMVAAVKAGKTVGRILGIRADSPVLRVQRTAYSYNDLPVDFRYRYVSTARHRYMITVGRAARFD